MEVEIIKAIQAGGTPFFDVFFKIISIMGSVWGFLLLSVIFIILQRRWISLIFPAGYGVFWAVNEAVKHIIRRPRPYQASKEVVAKVMETSFSMPSGHSFSVAFMCVWIAYFVCRYLDKKWLKVLTISSLSTFALLVAFSRMYLGVHYLSDVLIGLSYGTLCGLITILIYKTVEQKTEKK